jgi:hypothetical protein
MSETEMRDLDNGLSDYGSLQTAQADAALNGIPALPVASFALVLCATLWQQTDTDRSVAAY